MYKNIFHTNVYTLILQQDKYACIY